MASKTKATGGVLPISAIASREPSHINGTKSQNFRAPITRSKVVIRRLPPGLTKREFEESIGQQWSVGGGKVDWLSYKPGKVSKEIGKPSRPSRAYMHLIDYSQVEALNEKIRQTAFLDAQNTFNDSVLLGPPTLEYAPYSRIPGSKQRKDIRQGLIDQDPEFIEFLESLTSPIVKLSYIEQGQDKQEKSAEATVTPLIQYLRNKKLAKEKGLTGKSTKHARTHSKQDSKEIQSEAGKVKHAVKDNTDLQSKIAVRPSKIDKAKKTPPKLVKKEASPARSSNSTPAPVPTTKNDEAPVKKISSSPATAAARMIQRDLGIREGKAPRVRKGGEKKEETDVSSKPAPKETKSDANKATRITSGLSVKSLPPSNASEKGFEKEPDIVVTKPISTSSTSRRQHTSIPGSEKSSGTAGYSSESKITNTADSRGPKKPSQPPVATNVSVTQAFLKHANASQGITEPLIRKAMSAFGTVKGIEIDKKKGFAYVDFVESDSLRKAVAASPVVIAQGNVQVMERRERKTKLPNNSSASSTSIGSTTANPTASVNMANVPTSDSDTVSSITQPAANSSSRPGGGTSARGSARRRAPRGAQAKASVNAAGTGQAPVDDQAVS